MRRPGEYRASLILAGALAGSAMLAGCTAGEPRHESHYWNAREDQAYRAYLHEQHLQYREFRTLSHERQEDYWNWRARHPENPS